MTFQDATDAITTVSDHALEDTEAALLDTAQKAIGPIKDRWPVRTGFSRDRWKATRINAGAGAVIINSADYASHVDDGLADRLVAAALEENEPETIADVEGRISPRFEG